MFKYRYFNMWLCVVVSFFISCADNNKTSLNEQELIKKAKKIHENVLALDTHMDIEVTFITPGLLPYIESDIVREEDQMVSLQKMKTGGLDGGFFAVYIPQKPLTEKEFKAAHDLALEKFDKIHKAIKLHSTDIELANEPEDVSGIHSAGKKVAMIGIENGFCIENDLKNLKKFYDLGCRYMTLSHNGHNQICDSHVNPGGPESVYNGLSPFGRDVVREMNRLGIIVDISHLSKKSMLDVVKLSKAPVIASHSSIRALCDVSRNLDDEQLLALKENGGMINIVAINSFIKNESPEFVKERENLRKEFNYPANYWPFFFAYKKSGYEKQSRYSSRFEEVYKKYPQADIEDFVDHIDYAVKLIGIDHVGISSDFYEVDTCIKGWEDASETFNITLELVRRGYNEKEIGKLWGGNILQVWKKAKEVSNN